MSLQAQLVIIAWIPFVLYLFHHFEYQKAVVTSFIVAWLFLPQYIEFDLPIIPDFTRLTATCYSVLLAICIYDIKRLKSFKFGWLDLPMSIWCLCPFASSITNGLGAYDGLSGSLENTLTYGIPYFLGRIYLNNLKGIRQLAIGIFLGGLVYIPLCWLEVAISPQLHRMVYGYHGIRDFGQSIRYGGYRPNVFMQHGLSLGMWMMAATLIGVWLWQAKVIKRIGAFNLIFDMVWVTVILVTTVIVVKSTGAYFYLIYGLLVLFTAKWFKTALPLLIMIAMIFFYIISGATGGMAGETSDKIVEIATNIAGPDRAQSLEFRLDNEEILGEKAREKILFGWGGWNRNRVFDYNYLDELEDITVTDSLWIIAFGINGFVGMMAIFGSSLLPALSFCWHYPSRLWLKPQIAPAAALATVTVLYMFDCTLNNQPNPVYTLASGGIAGLVIANQQTKSIKYVLNMNKSNL